MIYFTLRIHILDDKIRAIVQYYSVLESLQYALLNETTLGLVSMTM
jgi:hypothetical protein